MASITPWWPSASAGAAVGKVDGSAADDGDPNRQVPGLADEGPALECAIRAHVHEERAGTRTEDADAGTALDVGGVRTTVAANPVAGDRNVSGLNR